MTGRAPVQHDPRWPVVSLADITTKIGSGATPQGGADAYLAHREKYALVRSQNVFDRRFDRGGLAFISDEQAAGLRNVILQRDDILLNITGDGITFGRACLVPEDVLPACVNQHVSIVRVDPRQAVPGYVLAFLTHPDVKAYIESFNAGGSRRAVTKGHIESFRLPLPPLIDQRAIANILGTLDDKIEVNRRMSGTLDTMVRALFKSWFVDFDPVRVKVEGGAFAFPEHLGDPLPARLVDSELGAIPERWSVGLLGDVAEHPRRGVQPNRIAQDTPYIALEHMPRNSIALTEWDVADELASGKFEFRRGEILFGKLRPYFHKVGVAPINGVCSTDIVVVTPKERRWFGFVLGHVSSSEFVDYTSAASTGTKMPRTSWADMARYRVAVPPESIAEAFTELVQPLLDRINTCIHESRTLTLLRAVLLPKLIIGEVRAPVRTKGREP